MRLGGFTRGRLAAAVFSPTHVASGVYGVEALTLLRSENAPSAIELYEFTFLFVPPCDVLANSSFLHHDRRTNHTSLYCYSILDHLHIFLWTLTGV